MLSSPSGLLLKGIFPKNFPISYWYNFLNHISQSSALGSFSYGDNQNKSFPVGNKIYAQMMSCKKNLDYTCSKLALLHWHKSLRFTIWQHSCELSRFFCQPGGNYSNNNLCSTLLFNDGNTKIFWCYWANFGEALFPLSTINKFPASKNHLSQKSSH